MLPVTCVGSLCKIHAVGLLCLKIADVHGIEVHDVRTCKFVSFCKSFRYLLHNTRDVTRGARGHNSLSAKSLRGAKKSQRCHKHFFQNSTVHLLPEDLRFEHGGAKLVSFPTRHLTSSRPCTSRLSGQNGEICLQKYLPISGKLSITNYLKQNAVDYRSHVTIENNVKVEKRYIISKTSTTFPPPHKTLGVHVKTNIPKEHERNAGISPWKVLIASQGQWNDQTVFGNAKFAVSKWPNSQSFNFLHASWLYRGNAILEILYSRLKNNY